MTALPRLKTWLLASPLLAAGGLLARTTSVSIPRWRERSDEGSIALLEPEIELEPERERALGDEAVEDDWPVLNVTMLGPDDDEGGPTSYYSGEVTGITQVLQLMHNVAAGRDPEEGLRDVPKDERVFYFDR